MTDLKKWNFFISEHNLGLAASIIAGVSKIFEIADEVIVLEDDLIVTSNFLSFMNQALTRFQLDKKVFSISGYSFNISGSKTTNYDAYFLNRGWSWGWATWKDRWKDIDWEVKDYNEFNSNRKLKASFNKGGSDLTAMLQKHNDGQA